MIACSLYRNVPTVAYLLVVSLHVTAQVNKDIRLLTPQEQQYVNTTKSLYQEYKKLYKQYQKDSTRLSKKVHKQVGSKSKEEIKQRVKYISDSLYQAYGLESYEPIAESFRQYASGEVDWEELYRKDKQYFEEELAKYNEFGELQEMKGELGTYKSKTQSWKDVAENRDSSFASQNFDQLAEKRLMEFDEVQELQKQSKALEELKKFSDQNKTLLDGYANRAGDLGNSDNLQSKALEQGRTMGTKFIQGKSGVLKGAQSKLMKLKKKYSYLPTSNDLAKAIKTNSLEEEPWRDRIIIGGNFQITRNNFQMNVDLAPVIGYRFNRKISVGVSGVYRVSFSTQNESLNYIQDLDVYGYRGFLEYNLIKGFFGHGEYERMNSEVELTSGDTYRAWSDGILVGLGKSYRIKQKLKGNVVVLYNTMHEAGVSPYNSPWQLRFGVGRL